MPDNFNWNDHPVASDTPKGFSWDDHPAVGGTKENPIESDIFNGDDTDRIKSSFGNPAGVGKMLLQKGFVDFDKNKDGDMIVKDTKGQWHKDASGLLSHPINWMESGAGKALPVAAGVAGGMAAGIPGAAAGGVGGEDVRQMIGHQMGTFDDSDDSGLGEMAKEGAISSVGQLAAPLANPITNRLGSAFAPKMISKEVETGLLDAAGSPITKSVSEAAPTPTGNTLPAYLMKKALVYGGAHLGPMGAVAADTLGDAAIPAVNAASRGASAIASPLLQAVAKNPGMLSSVVANPVLRDLISRALPNQQDSDSKDIHYDPSGQKVMPTEVAKEKFLQGN
jgi:hypothetical protein